MQSVITFLECVCGDFKSFPSNNNIIEITNHNLHIGGQRYGHVVKMFRRYSLNTLLHI